MNIVLTSYLTEQADPQRGTMWEKESHVVLDKWCDSIHKCGMDGIVVFDGETISPRLQRTITNQTEGAVTFVRADWQTPLNCTEERFYMYRDIIATGHPQWRTEDDDYEWILFTDLSDVEFYKNPFEFMEHSDALYVGSEPLLVGGCCVEKWMRDAYGEATNLDMQILNPGILGGHRDIIVPFLDCLIMEIERGKPRTMGLDLCAFNKLLRRTPIPFVTGHPLHTVFRNNEPASCGAYIRHK